MCFVHECWNQVGGYLYGTLIITQQWHLIGFDYVVKQCCWRTYKSITKGAFGSVVSFEKIVVNRMLEKTYCELSIVKR